MTVAVRPRCPTDVAGLVAVLAGVQATDRYPVLAEHVEPGWLTLPSGPTWVAEVDGAVVGQVALDEGLDAAHWFGSDAPPIEAYQFVLALPEPGV